MYVNQARHRNNYRHAIIVDTKASCCFIVRILRALQRYKLYVYGHPNCNFYRLCWFHLRFFLLATQLGVGNLTVRRIRAIDLKHSCFRGPIDPHCSPNCQSLIKTIFFNQIAYSFLVGSRDFIPASSEHIISRSGNCLYARYTFQDFSCLARDWHLSVPRIRAISFSRYSYLADRLTSVTTSGSTFQTEISSQSVKISNYVTIHQTYTLMNEQTISIYFYRFSSLQFRLSYHPSLDVAYIVVTHSRGWGSWLARDWRFSVPRIRAICNHMLPRDGPKLFSRVKRYHCCFGCSCILGLSALELLIRSRSDYIITPQGCAPLSRYTFNIRSELWRDDV